jgi:hypothetical protein
MPNHFGGYGRLKKIKIRAWGIQSRAAKASPRTIDRILPPVDLLSDFQIEVPPGPSLRIETDAVSADAG